MHLFYFYVSIITTMNHLHFLPLDLHLNQNPRFQMMHRPILQKVHLCVVKQFLPMMSIKIG